MKALVYSYPEFKIKYISNLNEVQEGFIVIPPTSSKSVNMETEKFAILNGDFTDDPTLNLLYETRGLEDIAMAKFKTYGSSKIFVHESEVTTYRDVFLHQITDYDRWIGHGWVVSAKDVQKILTSHNCDSSVGKPA